MKGINVVVQQGDVTSYRCDVLVLKYAQALHGVDAAVVERLERSGIHIVSRLPAVSDYILVDSQDILPANLVILVGVKAIFQFDYQQIRKFGKTALDALATEVPETRHLATTLHGAGFGLDEVEAFDSQIAGFMDAVSAGKYPRRLTTITIVERSVGRAERLNKYLKRILPDSIIPVPSSVPYHGIGQEASERLESVGYESSTKPHIFVAMPFSDDMEDTYHYGIQGAVNAAGFLCERADLSSFTGDVISWVKERIGSASLVVADLTGANPNVYLEVGYAWGCNRPTVLLVRNADELKFDVKGQRCLTYSKIKDLEQLLGEELKNLKKGMKRHV